MNRSADIRSFPAVVAALLLSVAAAGAWLFFVAPTKEPASLQATIDEVSRRWPQIGHITPAELAPLLRDRHVLLFDVREEPEYQVSHLPGAIRISPENAPAEFLARFGTASKARRSCFIAPLGCAVRDLPRALPKA